MLQQLLNYVWHRRAAKRAAAMNWEKCDPALPKRLLDGKLSLPDGQMWRRWNGNRWEYRQDSETEDEWMHRQI